MKISRKLHLALAVILSVGSIAAATWLVSVSEIEPGGISAGQRSSRTRRAQRRPARQPAQQARQIRATDANRAPQAAVDQALYADEEFFGVTAVVTRPYLTALEQVTALQARYPKDPVLRLHAARLAERLGEFDRAIAEMNQYVVLKARSPDSLRRLADFYHKRARYADEVRTLLELANAIPASDRGAVYRRAANVVRSRALKQFEPAAFFSELVAADPTNIQPVKDYAEELELAGRPQEAASVLLSFQPRFPSELEYFLERRSRLLEIAGERDAAEAVYSGSFNPTWPRAIAADYYDLLRRFGRYRGVRRQFQDRIRAGAADVEAYARLFSIFAYEGNYTEAGRLIETLERRRAERISGGAASDGRPQQAESQTVEAGRWSSKELETVAAMLASIGYYDQASRYLYTLYLVGGLQPGSEPREFALYMMFKAMIDAEGVRTRVAGGDLSFYSDIGQIDQNPGFMNGVLSLILAGTEPASEFAAQEERAARYFNRALAYRIFSAFKQEYAASRYLPEMYLGVIDTFSSFGEHKLAIEAGREFQQRFPDSPRHAQVSLRIGDSYVALKDRSSERAVLQSLLDRLAAQRRPGSRLLPSSSRRWSWGATPAGAHLIDRIKYTIQAYSDTWDPTEDIYRTDEEYEIDEEEEKNGGPATGPTYSGVLERYVASLAAEDKKTETVAFFWREIKKHPKEEGLYERFLRWLGQSQLVSEQLVAYNSAVREFDSNTWYHRLARWYVRQKRGRDLAGYSRQLIDIFDEEEITDYLLRFAGYGATTAGDSLDWDQRLAFNLYSYAHARFPRNLFFVRGMLTYLEKNDRAGWERLSARYYFTDRSIRDPYLAWLSRQGQLRERYNEARTRGQVAATDRGQSPQQVTPYRIFGSDAAVWLSHHEEAVEAYRQLVDVYPGEPQHADRLADIARSLGQQDNSSYEEAGRVLTRMANIYPYDHSYRIKAGEVYAEMGDFERAATEWKRLVELEPADRDTFLEVATVFWDYYQFDDAIQIFRRLREVSGDQTLFAYRLGAVYEGKGDLDSAIAEYIKVLSEPGQGRDTVASRLAQLARRAGVAERIAASYDAARNSKPQDWQLIIGFAFYEAERERMPDALALLRAEVARSRSVPFLESVRDFFRSALRPEDEQLVIERLAEAARDERESMMYRLQLAAFLERQGRVDSAIRVIDSLVAEYPNNLGVVEESSRFYWRSGVPEKALDLFKQSLTTARGPASRSLRLQLARRQLEAGHLAEAESALRSYYDANRWDSEAFRELASVLGAAKKFEDLAELYRTAYRDVQESGVDVSEARSRITELRTGLIRTFTSLSRFDEALDQHIEIVNASPEDADKLAAAIDYAEAHSQTGRLSNYYEKLASEAYKNYRWQLVLGRIYERLGNLERASEQYRLVVVNEPQRADLRFGLASALARQGRNDEAIAVLRDGWNLAGRDPEWLIEVARIQVYQGRREEAVQTMRQALSSRQNASANAKFRIAAQLVSWGLYLEAAGLYEGVFSALPRTLKDETVEAKDVIGYVKSLVRSEPAENAFRKIEKMRAQYSAIARNSQDTDGYKAEYVVNSLDQAMRADFGVGVTNHSTAAEMGTLGASMRAALSGLTSYGDRNELLRYLGIARGAGLVDVEEDIHTRLKDAAFKARSGPQDVGYYQELRSLIAFYNRHAVYGRAAEVLGVEFARDPYKDRFDYQNQMAIEYRLAGNTGREIEVLRSAYRAASGDLTPDHSDWVDRYFSLVYSVGRRAEFAALASLRSPYQLQLINFLVENGERELALNAIQVAGQTPAWVAARSAEVGLFLKDRSAETEDFFRAALAVRTIGETLGNKPDLTRVLVGEDWFILSRNFGYWLGMVGREVDSRRFIVGEVEKRPGSANSHLEVAAYYLDRGDSDRAAEHVALAGEIAPADRNVTIMRGAVVLAKGDRNLALKVWTTLLRGRASVRTAQTFLQITADKGLLTEALPHLEDFIVSYVNRAGRNTDRQNLVESIAPLVREIAVRAMPEKEGLAAAAALERAIRRLPDDLSLGRMLIEEGLLPESARGTIYRDVHQRLQERAAAVFGTPEYENGYWDGDRYFYPANELNEWRRQLMDHLIRSNALNEARLLIVTIKQELRVAGLTLEPDQENGPEAPDRRYDWLPLAIALVELRGGNTAAALGELRRYCGIDETGTDRSAVNAAAEMEGLDERCLKAYALLAAEGKRAEAEELLYSAYRRAAGTQYSTNASLAGLAAIEARRGRGDEASRLLKLLVQRSTNNLTALQLAAETAARAGRFADAIEFRTLLGRANASDSVNRLELARALWAHERKGESLAALADLIGDTATPNRVRAQSIEVLGELVGKDPQSASSATEMVNRIPEGSAERDLAHAAVAEAIGNSSQARSLVVRIKGPLAAIAQMKLGMMALNSSQYVEAIRAFEQAVYLDAGGLLTDSIAFRAPGPRAQLIMLYARMGRDLAAIRMAEESGPDDSSDMTGIIRAALAQAESPQRTTSALFEPSLDSVRPRDFAISTLEELNTLARVTTRSQILVSLAGSAARLGQHDRAVALERLRLRDIEEARERTAIEARLKELMSAEEARRSRLSALLRVDRSNTTAAIYARRVVGDQ